MANIRETAERISPESSRTLSHTSTNEEYGDRERDDDSSSNHTGTDLSLTRTTSRRPLESVISRVRSRVPITFRHSLSIKKTTEDVVVHFDGPDDPYKALNWTPKKKIITTALYGLTTMTATWASSTFSPGTVEVSKDFHVGTQVATLGTSLFLFGFGVGPLLWAPLSEVYGRKLAVLAPMFVSACFCFGTAVAKDLQTVMITRFFAGFFSSAPVTNTGGVLGDLFTADKRGYAIAGYAMAVVGTSPSRICTLEIRLVVVYFEDFSSSALLCEIKLTQLAGGPVIGPIVGAAFVANKSLGWRWTEYFTGILQLFILVVDLIFLDESYPPVILVYKARRLRYETGNWALHARHEEWDISIRDLARKFLVRPFQLLGTPICFLVALYASFCYGILYMQLGGIPIIFGEERGWPAVSTELPFLSILIGAILGCGANVYNQKIYNKYFFLAGSRAVPEKRLPPMCVGSVFFASGLFITGWTADPKFPWIAPVLGLVAMGFGFFTIFQAAINYLVDTFTQYGASAIAANTFLRSCFAGAFPLVVSPLYHNIGVGPGSTITGGFACLMIPVPFFFYFFGKRLRASSKWSRDSI
jgi:DHA1 family multidrug resistance protein-like MFS transporter